MAFKAFLLLVVFLCLVLNLPMAGYKPDEATREQMAQRALFLRQETAALWEEIEKAEEAKTMEIEKAEEKTMEQSGFAWRTLLWAILRQLRWLVIAEVLLLLLFEGYWSICRLQLQPLLIMAAILVLPLRLCWWFCSLWQLKGKDDKKQNEPERSCEELPKNCEEAKELLSSLVHNIRQRLSNSSFPVLEPPIGVGRAFEGWGPREGDSVYQFLVPLKVPRDYKFYTEKAAGKSAGNFRIRVGLQCTCTTEQHVQRMRCFLHDPDKEPRGNQDPKLLLHLCTDSFLDVQKIAPWFQANMKAAWEALPLSSQCTVWILPSRRSCKYQLERDGRITPAIEIFFGVRQGYSDIFLISQTSGTPRAPRTMWSVTCAVAEVKFFRHMARKAPTRRVYLKCLQTCARIWVGRNLPAYAYKTAVMHLLTTARRSRWATENFVPRMREITRFLCRCVDEGRLNHFFTGNENVPWDIILPPQFRTAQPLNLFQALTHQPRARARARHELRQLRHWLSRVLIFKR